MPPPTFVALVVRTLFLLIVQLVKTTEFPAVDKFKAMAPPA
jgi:hypothetical protein